MKRILIAALLILGTVGVFAQAGTWYFSVLPGYQFTSTGTDYHYNYYGVDVAERTRGKSNFMGSLDGGYFFNDVVGLHFAYVYNPGNYKDKLYINGGYIGEWGLKRQVNLLQIGPEFVFGNKVDQGYFQLNVGWTFGSGNTKINFGGTYYDMGNTGSNKFAWGAGLGYRHFWGNTGIDVRTDWNHIQNWPVNNGWDIRCGVTWKF